MPKKTVRDVDVRNKRVLVRVDFNVPLKNGQVKDDTRIRAALPTILYLKEQGAKVILASHLGRPKGKVSDELRLKPVAARLSEIIGEKVAQTEDCVGSQVQEAVQGLASGEVLLLENLRFHPEEEKNNPEFAQQLAALAEIYVNDAFGTAHRAHASTEGVAHFLPAVSGFLMEKEIEFLGKALREPEHPFVAILGGAKVSDKIGVIRNLLNKVNFLLIGGGMANTFLAAQGYGVGRSLLEEDKIGLASDLLRESQSYNVTISLPIDVVVSADSTGEKPGTVVQAAAVPAGEMICDIGPETAKRFAEVIQGARTVVWNGPMGIFESPPFSVGTNKVAEAVAANPGLTVVGGGDSVAAVKQAGLASRVKHISTGGGASLEFLEGKSLPGVEVLLNA